MASQKDNIYYLSSIDVDLKGEIKTNSVSDIVCYIKTKKNE
jgi:hypothetical protein